VRDTTQQDTIRRHKKQQYAAAHFLRCQPSNSHGARHMRQVHLCTGTSHPSTPRPAIDQRVPGQVALLVAEIAVLPVALHLKRQTVRTATHLRELAQRGRQHFKAFRLQHRTHGFILCK
jgi:hypothetical protein